MDALQRIERWVKVKNGEMPDFTGNGPWGDTLHEDLVAAVAEIKRLRALVGVASNLPAKDQERLDRAYGDRKPPE